MFARPHVIVCGPPDELQGVADGFRNRRTPVRTVPVGPDKDAAANLKRIEPATARALVVVWDDDKVSAETANMARELCMAKRPRKAGPLPVVLLYGDIIPSEALNRLADDLSASDLIAPRIFSMPGRAARLLFNRYPLHAYARASAGEALHILIAGFGALGKAIALQFMHLAHYGGPRGRITILDPNPSMRGERFISSYPQACNICDIDFQELGRPTLDAGPAVTGAYICLEAQSETIRTSRKLRKLFLEYGWSPPIFPHLNNFQPSTNPHDWDGQTLPFSTSDHVRAVARMLDNRGDEQAETIHNYYRDSIVSQGQDLDATPAGRPWDGLDESYREASRHQADHLEAKLAAIGCRSVPEEQSGFFAFTHLEVEKLALIEHDRWSADRSLAGWVYGPERDNTRKIHPQLVPYAELSKAMKDLDRYAVRLLPVLFGRNGRSIARNLEIGVIGQFSGSIPTRILKRQIKVALGRISRRIPRHFPVLVTAMNNHFERLAAQVALEKFGMALRVLLTRPVGEILDEFDDGKEKQAYLRLLAQAEHRYALDGETGLHDFMAKGPDILIVIGDVEGMGGDTVAEIVESRERNAMDQRLTPDQQRARGTKVVRLDPGNDNIEWSFEY